jgi:hypothetical protein
MTQSRLRLSGVDVLGAEGFVDREGGVTASKRTLVYIQSFCLFRTATVAKDDSAVTLQANKFVARRISLAIKSVAAFVGDCVE